MPPATLQWFFLPRHCPHVELKAFRTYGVNFSWQDFTNLIGDIMEYHQRIYIYIYIALYIYILPHETCLLFHIIYYITQRIFTRKDVGHTVSKPTDIWVGLGNGPYPKYRHLDLEHGDYYTTNGWLGVMFSDKPRWLWVIITMDIHGLEWILGLDSLGVHRVWCSQQLDGQY